MQRRRVFIAINLSGDIKKKLAEFQKKRSELPVRWTKSENLHITLDFLGYLRDEELLEVSKTVKEVALKHTPFEIKLTKICYGPTDKKPPRMIWALGERSEEFSVLKENLDKILGVSEGRVFSPHITLGRLRQWEWRRIEPEERPVVDEEINLSFLVESIEVMESVLKKAGVEYAILESLPLDGSKT